MAQYPAYLQIEGCRLIAPEMHVQWALLQVCVCTQCILLGSNYFPQLEYKKNYSPNLLCLMLVSHVCSVKESLNRNNKQKTHQPGSRSCSNTNLQDFKLWPRFWCFASDFSGDHKTPAKPLGDLVYLLVKYLPSP